jgi:hypothetical protein
LDLGIDRVITGANVEPEKRPLALEAKAEVVCSGILSMLAGATNSNPPSARVFLRKRSAALGPIASS